VDKIVAIGTKKDVVTLSVGKAEDQVLKKGDITFSYKEILNNMQLTAYTADEGGKARSHPYYGYTASGTKATEGRTIAVDPNVIPMGWWVYIEGIGYRRAEDTGSAIKGKIIDVFYENQDYVNKFGRKRGFTVYVIGPKKPAVD
jgi:3D (Asp-Asp-Asp) domain-containing protein